MNNTGFTSANNQLLATPYADHLPKPIRMVDGQEISFGQGNIIYSPSRAFDKYAYPSGGAGMLGTAGDYLYPLNNPILI